MSKTIKDQPLSVRVEWWTTRHVCSNSPCNYIWRREGGPCDLPPEPIRQGNHAAHRAMYAATRCVWWPESDHREPPRNHPPRWFLRSEITGNTRLRARRQCARAVGEHRGGEVVTEPTTEQHRHRGIWAWW